MLAFINCKANKHGQAYISSTGKNCVFQLANSEAISQLTAPFLCHIVLVFICYSTSSSSGKQKPLCEYTDAVH